MWNWLVRFWRSLMRSNRSKFDRPSYRRSNLRTLVVPRVFRLGVKFSY
jgi:hypothetical protein